MDNNLNKKDIQNAADQIVETAKEQAQANISIFENIGKEINKINPELGDLTEIATFLTLDEDKFAMLSPVFLQEIARSINTVNDKTNLAIALNAAGASAEEIRKNFFNLANEIDTKLDMLSQQKRDFLKQLLGIMYNAIAETEGVYKRVIEIPIELLSKDINIPTYAHDTDAGADVFSPNEYDIAPGETIIIPLGFKIALPQGYAFLIQPRSGLSSKTKMRIANTPGLCDAGYRGEYGVIIENIEPKIVDIDYSFNDDGSIKINSILHGKTLHIDKNQKIAQLRLVEVPMASFYEVESVQDIGEDRNGGFGSTDKNEQDNNSTN